MRYSLLLVPLLLLAACSTTVDLREFPRYNCSYITEAYATNYWDGPCATKCSDEDGSDFKSWRCDDRADEEGGPIAAIVCVCEGGGSGSSDNQSNSSG